MAVVNRQTLQIATLDGYPFTGVGGGSQTGRLTGGQNAAQEIQQVEGNVLPVAGDSIGSYYQLARVPSSAVIKSVEIMQTGMAATPVFDADVTIGVSDSTIDGTQPGLQAVPSGLTTTTNGFVANPALTTTGLSGANALFASNQLIGGFTAATWVDVTFINFAAQYTATKAQQPVWQAAGYAQDTGGFFDIVLLSTTAVASGTMGTVQARVRYTVPTG